MGLGERAIEVADAETRVAEVLNAVAGGERIKLVRDGKVVARLDPPALIETLTPEERAAFHAYANESGLPYAKALDIFLGELARQDGPANGKHALSYDRETLPAGGGAQVWELDEAASCFADIVGGVERGGRFAIFRKGGLVARVFPPLLADSMTEEERTASIEWFKERQKELPRSGMTEEEIVALIREERPSPQAQREQATR